MKKLRKLAREIRHIELIVQVSAAKKNKTTKKQKMDARVIF